MNKIKLYSNPEFVGYEEFTKILDSEEREYMDIEKKLNKIELDVAKLNDWKRSEDDDEWYQNLIIRIENIEDEIRLIKKAIK